MDLLGGHCITNLYAPERNVWIVSDPPHLLKTSRNNLANSGSGLNTRYLWVSEIVRVNKRGISLTFRIISLNPNFTLQSNNLHSHFPMDIDNNQSGGVANCKKKIVKGNSEMKRSEVDVHKNLPPPKCNKRVFKKKKTVPENIVVVLPRAYFENLFRLN